MINVDKASQLVSLVTTMMAFRQLAESLIRATDPQAVVEFIAGQADELGVTANELHQIARVLAAIADGKGKKGDSSNEQR